MIEDIVIGRRVERGISIAVIILILWLGVTTDYFVLLPWIGSVSAQSEFPLGRICIFSLFNFVWLMALWSMVMVSFTDPGRIPEDYTREKDRSMTGVSYLEAIGWCRKCNKARPPRTHHCRACGTCRLRMDHHCPWIGNCVGYWNHGLFLRFLTYAFFGLLFSFFISLFYLMFRMPILLFDEFSEMQIVIVVINGVFSLCLMVLVGILGAYQWSNCLWDMTTIEHLEWDTAESRAGRSTPSPQIIFPYDLGWRENLKAVLGPNPWLWPLPLPSSYTLRGHGDGLTFRMSREGLVWPPVFQSPEADSTELRPTWSDPALCRRDRFRRGSEGFMIPVDQIGVQLYSSDDEGDYSDDGDQVISNPLLHTPTPI